MKSQPKIILASESPRRLQLLENADIQVEVLASPYEEHDQPGLKPIEIAKNHAFGKAKAVADILAEGIVIGCDTVVDVNGKLLEKPRDREHAKEMIELQQGQTIEVVSGISIIDSDRSRVVISSETTQVTFHPMTSKEIEWYLDTEEWQDKSGGFAIQGKASRFIAKVQGDSLSVVGLPVQKIYQALKNWGYDLCT